MQNLVWFGSWKCLLLSVIKHISGLATGYWGVKTETYSKTSGVKPRWHCGCRSVFAYFQFQAFFPSYTKMFGWNTKTRHSISWNRSSSTILFLLLIYFLMEQREAGIWKPHLCESKALQLDTAILSRTLIRYYSYFSYLLIAKNSLCPYSWTPLLPPAKLRPNCQLETITGLRCSGHYWAGCCAAQSCDINYTMFCTMSREHTSAWASAPGLFSSPTTADTVCRAAEIAAHTGREEGSRGQQSHLPSSTISLCQLTLLMEFQLSPDSSINSPPPDLHCKNTAVSVYHRQYTSPAQKVNATMQLFCPVPTFCCYVHSISVVWPLVSTAEDDSPTQGITVQRSWASPDEPGELLGTAREPRL